MLQVVKRTRIVYNIIVIRVGNNERNEIASTQVVFVHGEEGFSGVLVIKTQKPLQVFQAGCSRVK